MHRVYIERVCACIECASSVCVERASSVCVERASSVYQACAECASSVYLVLVQAAPLCANYTVCKLLCVVVTVVETSSYRAAASITMCNV